MARLVLGLALLAHGARGDGFVEHIETKDLPLGRWRVRLEGHAGGDRVPFHSEWLGFVLKRGW